MNEGEQLSDETRRKAREVFPDATDAEIEYMINDTVGGYKRIREEYPAASDSEVEYLFKEGKRMAIDEYADRLWKKYWGI